MGTKPPSERIDAQRRRAVRTLVAPEMFPAVASLLSGTWSDRAFDFSGPVVHQQANRLQSDRRKMIGALAQTGETVIKRQVRHISIPRRFSQMARDIWTAQPRFHRTQGKQPLRLLAFPVFRAAYDFMCIQAMVGLFPHKLSHWWTDFQLKNQVEHRQERKPAKRPRRRPRRNAN